MNLIFFIVNKGGCERVIIHGLPKNLTFFKYEIITPKLVKSDDTMVIDSQIPHTFGTKTLKIKNSLRYQ